MPRPFRAAILPLREIARRGHQCGLRFRLPCYEDFTCKLLCKGLSKMCRDLERLHRALMQKSRLRAPLRRTGDLLASMHHIVFCRFDEAHTHAIARALRLQFTICDAALV